MRVALFVSRNKDNKQQGFEERRATFLTNKTDEELKVDFQSFLREGEFSRLYISVNKRDSAKTMKALQHFLLDNPDYDLTKLESKLAGLASRKENASEHKWMFDVDLSPDDYAEFALELNSLVEGAKTYKTPNNYSMVVPHGFDTRELLSKWEDVELKRDDMLCLDWGQG